MNAARVERGSPTSVVVLRWAARIGSVPTLWLLTLFLFGGLEPGLPTLKEAVAMAFFPFGVMAGMVWGWRNELVGGLISVISLAVFYVVMVTLGGRFPGGPYFLIFASPGFAFLACGLLARRLRAA
jgi:hypothetical protein